MCRSLLVGLIMMMKIELTDYGRKFEVKKPVQIAREKMQVITIDRMER